MTFRHSTLVCILLGLFQSSVLAADEPAKPSTAKPDPIEIKSERPGATLKLTSEGTKTILAISSADRGIATLTRTAEHWPGQLTLRIYLSGLEQLTIIAGDEKLSASVLSHGDHQRVLNLWKDKKESDQLTKESPYWMEIQIFDPEGKPINALPKKGGWFEMTVPKALLTDANKTIRLNWLAFYL